MSGIPDYSESELEQLREVVERRYGKPVALQLADAELRLAPGSSELTLCPTVVWSARDANFAVFKVGGGRYRPQFYYRGYEQFGTGVSEYADLRECATILLQLQAAHEAERQVSLPPVKQKQ